MAFFSSYPPAVFPRAPAAKIAQTPLSLHSAQLTQGNLHAPLLHETDCSQLRIHCARRSMPLHSTSNCRRWKSLSQTTRPWLQLTSGTVEQFTLTAKGSPQIDGKPQPISLQLVRFNKDAFDLQVEHPEYAVSIRRRAEGIAFCVPKHKAVYLGAGPSHPTDHLQPAGILDRLVSSGTSVRTITQLLGGSNAEDVAGALQTLTKIEYREDDQSWHIDDATVQFPKTDIRPRQKSITPRSN